MGTFYGPSISPDEIYHWKYKRKFRKNGHWVYVYDDDSMSEAGSVESTVGGSLTGKEQSITTRTVITNPNQWFDSKKKVEKTGFSGEEDRSFTGYKKETITYGRLHMMRMNTERHVSDAVEKGAKAINKGRKKIQKLLGRLW